MEKEREMWETHQKMNRKGVACGEAAAQEIRAKMIQLKHADIHRHYQWYFKPLRGGSEAHIAGSLWEQHQGAEEGPGQRH